MRARVPPCRYACVSRCTRTPTQRWAPIRLPDLRGTSSVSPEQLRSRAVVRHHQQKADSCVRGCVPATCAYARALAGRWHFEVYQLGALQRAAMVACGAWACTGASTSDARKAFEKAMALEPSRLEHACELAKVLRRVTCRLVLRVLARGARTRTDAAL